MRPFQIDAVICLILGCKRDWIACRLKVEEEQINQSTDLVIVWDLDEEKVEVVGDGNNIAYHYLC
jgi:hypothetical protein